MTQRAFIAAQHRGGTAATPIFRSVLHSVAPLVIPEDPAVDELRELQMKLDAAISRMHQNEFIIRRLELVVAGAIQPQPLVADVSTDTSLDFGYDGSSGSPSPYLHVIQLRAAVARERERLDSDRATFLQRVTGLTAESYSLMTMLGHYGNTSAVNTVEGFLPPAKGSSPASPPADGDVAPSSEPMPFGVRPVAHIPAGFVPLPAVNLMN